MTGLIHCGVCDAPYAAIGRDYLGCSKARRHRTCANGRSIARTTVEARMLTDLKEKLMAPDLAAAFVAALNAELNRPRDEGAASRVVLEHETAELQRKAEQLLDAEAEGSLSGTALELVRALIERLSVAAAADGPVIELEGALAAWCVWRSRTHREGLTIRKLAFCSSVRRKWLRGQATDEAHQS